MWSTFTSPLHMADITRLEQGRPIRVLTKPFIYHVGEFPSADLVKIPAGYCSDGASVPRPFRWVIQPWGVYARAAIVHDFLYSTQSRSRLEADQIFREAIKIVTEDSKDKVKGSNHDPHYTWRGRFTAFAAYWGVRIGGKFGYANGRNNYENRARRALNKVEDRDRKLFFLIIPTPNELNRRSLELSLEDDETSPNND